MTGKSLNPGVVRNKLEAIDRALQGLASIDGLDATMLRNDVVVAAAVERLLCRLVDLANDTNAHIAAAVVGRAPGDYRESFDLACEAGAITRELADSLKPSVGLRNTVVHEYVNIDYDIVAAAVPKALESYADYRRQVAAFTASSSSRAQA